MNNQHFPWLILVPRKENLREIFDLDDASYMALMQEVRDTTQKIAAHSKADKMNVATLGNMVPQLHIHIIARFEGDKAWPNPVWASAAAPYPPALLKETAQKWENILAITN